MTPFTKCLQQVTQSKKLGKISYLRCAIDWQTILYKHFVSPSRWDELQTGAATCIDGVRLNFEARLQSASTILQTEGWYIRLLDPRLDWTAIEKRTNIPVYGVEIQAQGRYWASGGDFRGALKQVETLLGLRNDLHIIDSDGNRNPFYNGAAVDDDDRIPGRIDLALDLWLRDDGCLTGEDLYRTLIADGNPGRVREVWVTRAGRAQVGATPRSEAANKHGEIAPMEARSVADAKQNITLYLGTRGHLQLCIYRKDADYKGNAREALESRWRKAGWDGSGVIARIEFRLSREVIREWQWDIKNVGTFAGGDMTLGGVYKCLDSAWKRCLDLYRHAPKRAGKERARDREDSAIWRVARDATPTFETQLSAEIMHSKRQFEVDVLRERAWHALVNVQEAAGADASDDLARWVKSGSPQVEEYRQTTAWRGFKERMNYGRFDTDDTE